MKLTIKHTWKIVGRPVTDDWFITHAIEQDEEYVFRLQRAYPNDKTVADVILNRNPIVEWDGVKYRFERDNAPSWQQVTPDWFADMDNAVSAIAVELRHAKKQTI